MIGVMMTTVQLGLKKMLGVWFFLAPSVQVWLCLRPFSHSFEWNNERVHGS